MLKEEGSKFGYSEDFYLMYIIKKGQDKKQINTALVELWEKYDLLRTKDKNALIGIARANGVSMESEFFDDYESNSYDYFIKAIDSVDIDRKELLKIQGTWKFWLQYHRYLMCYNRTIITAAKNKHKFETTEWARGKDNELISKIDLNPNECSPSPHFNMENEEMSRIQRVAIEKSLKAFSPIERQIWDLKAEGKQNKEVASILKISSKDVSQQLQIMKKMVDDNIVSASWRNSIIDPIPIGKKRISFDMGVYEVTKRGKSRPKFMKNGEQKMEHYDYVYYT